MDAQAGYGLWPLVIVNTALFVVFAASFFHPRTGRDWRAMGAFTAFLEFVAACVPRNSGGLENETGT